MLVPSSGKHKLWKNDLKNQLEWLKREKKKKKESQYADEKMALLEILGLTDFLRTSTRWCSTDRYPYPDKFEKAGEKLWGYTEVGKWKVVSGKERCT